MFTRISNLPKTQTTAAFSPRKRGSRAALATLRMLVLAGAAVATTGGLAHAGRICDANAARDVQVHTSSRKSYVSVQPCFDVTGTTIRPVLKWGNKRGSLGCYISWLPGCSIDAWKSEVDFHWINFSMRMTLNGKAYSWSCPINVGSVNKANNYEGGCVGPTFKTRGTYVVSGRTEFDVKDDGKDGFSLSSGAMSRKF